MRAFIKTISNKWLSFNIFLVSVRARIFLKFFFVLFLLTNIIFREVTFTRHRKMSCVAYSLNVRVKIALVQQEELFINNTKHIHKNRICICSLGCILRARAVLSFSRRTNKYITENIFYYISGEKLCPEGAKLLDAIIYNKHHIRVW